ncbi:tail assembly protein [Cardiobacteriaceae bacterium TAE3-ERU3]|nr:tail assembly protein [Cardiobacteriaceae bacterium TAE3-ERU3]
MATVVFYGDLRERYGSRFDLCVETAGEAIRALYMQIDGLKQHLIKGAYFVRVAKNNVTESNAEDRLHGKLNDDDVIHVVPEAAGGGRFGQIIAGAVLIVAGYLVTGLSYGWAAPVGGAMINLGIGLIAGGVAQLLIKPPSYDTKQGSDSSKSSSFTNLDNISPQGAHVPVAYGYLEVGSVVVSQSIESYDLKEQAEKPTGGYSYTRQYFAPTPVDGSHVPDYSDDDVRAHNYKLVVAEEE